MDQKLREMHAAKPSEIHTIQSQPKPQKGFDLSDKLKAIEERQKRIEKESAL